MSGKKPKLIMAKELVDHFADQGIEIHYAYARAIIRACPQSVRKRYVLASDAWTYWVLHPDLKPFGRTQAQRGLSEIGTRDPGSVFSPALEKR